MNKSNKTYQFKRTVILKPEDKAKIVVVDLGMGNLGSIRNMFKVVGIEATITRNIEKIKKAQKLVLPGVGAFDTGMSNLQKYKLIPVLNELVLKKKIPVIGICLGMQLMAERSEEGNLAGLGWIKGSVKRFNNGLKVPQMGWNKIIITKKHPLTDGMEKGARFYFVHSYYMVCIETKDILTQTDYGDSFVSSFQKGNIFGVQFHPEKSHRFGMELLRNFGSKI